MVTLKISLPQDFLNDEPRTIVVPSERKQLWAVLLDLALEFDRVCRENGIRYFIDGGTVLGAVRHRGFVPWDDDLDVILDRGEYERLCALAPTAFKSPYFFQTNETDPGSARGHAQLRNCRTTAILKSEMDRGRALFPYNQGVFIDIFPYDNIPDDSSERERFLQALEVRRRKVHAAKRAWLARQRPFFSLCHPSLCRDLLCGLRDCVVDLLVGGDAISRAYRAFERLVRKYECNETKCKAPISLDPHHCEILPASFFKDDPVYLDFEFVRLPAMKRHLEALEIHYGNWRKQIVGADEHGGLFVDLDHPYTQYLRSAAQRSNG